jgi:hypothetical protein
MEVSKDDVTPEKSAEAVNKCIEELSSGRKVVIGRWGDVRIASEHTPSEL